MADGKPFENRDLPADRFGRYTHAEFARFLTIARGSLSETQDHLIDAKDQGFSARKFDELWNLSNDGMRLVSSLLSYLRTHPTPDVLRLAPPPENE